MFKNLIFLLLTLVLIGCQDENVVEENIAKIPVDIKVRRFDKAFAEASPEQLPELKINYPSLFPKQFPDSIWVSLMNDTIQQELSQEVLKKFPEFNEQQEKIAHFFQHLKYYFPGTQVPNIVTVTSEVDYKNKVIANDSLLLISLDTYLGADHKFYVGIQDYIRKNFTEDNIVPDISNEYAKMRVMPAQSRSLLASMIYYGKILYLKDLLIPEFSDAQKIGYTEKEMEWAKANEEQIWRYFIDRELLFDTNSELQRRFINLAPFTKFQLQLDRESPPQLGQYIGWQIVKQFAEKNSVPLEKLLKMEAETLFRQSKFKPKKSDS